MGARVLAHKASQSLVEYTALLSEEGGDGEDGIPLQEWVWSVQLRAPPPSTPPQFAEGLRAGDVVELKLNDAWWEVRLVRTHSCKPRGRKDFLVASEVYGTEHWVQGERLRPSLSGSTLGGWSALPSSSVGSVHTTGDIIHVSILLLATLRPLQASL